MSDTFDHEEDARNDEAGRAEHEPGEVRCKFCGSTEVYWMTVLPRREAEWHTRNGNLRALHLAKAHLYNVAGGEHNCRSTASPDEFPIE